MCTYKFIDQVMHVISLTETLCAAELVKMISICLLKFHRFRMENLTKKARQMQPQSPNGIQNFPKSNFEVVDLLPGRQQIRLFSKVTVGTREEDTYREREKTSISHCPQALIVQTHKQSSHKSKTVAFAWRQFLGYSLLFISPIYQFAKLQHL